jgi:hypothetical protein
MSNTLTTGNILNEVQSEIPQLNDTKQVYRAINRVLRDINTEYPGVLTTEAAITTIAEAETGLTYTAADADPDTITAADFSAFPTGEAATDWADYYLVITNSDSNDGIYKIATTSTTMFTLAANQGLTAATETATLQVVSVNSDYSWDSENLLLTLTPYCREIREVIYNDGTDAYELSSEDIKTVQNYDADASLLYSSKYMFARYDRNKLLFPTTLIGYSSNSTVKVTFLKDIKPLSKEDSLSDSTEISIPLSMEQILINGVLYYLYSMPKYSNENLWKINERAYLSGLAAGKESEIQNLPQEPKAKDYSY